MLNRIFALIAILFTLQLTGCLNVNGKRAGDLLDTAYAPGDYEFDSDIQLMLINSPLASRMFIIPFAHDVNFSVSGYPDPSLPSLGNSQCTGDNFPGYSGHEGTDYLMPVGTPIYAAASGTITNTEEICSGWLCYGKYSYINHGGNRWSLYAHLSVQLIPNGTYVQQGQLIGYSGSTGTPTPHLHFEIITGSSAFATPHNPYYCNYEWFELNDDGSPKYADQLCVDTTHTYEVRAAFINGTSNAQSWYHTPGNVLKRHGTVVNNISANNPTLKWMAADVTGDGIDDLIQINTTSSKTYAQVYRATGHGGFHPREPWLLGSTSNGTAGKAIEAFVGRFGTDNKADLILGFRLSDGKMRWNKCISEGDQFRSCVTWADFGMAGQVFLFDDFDGNGRGEMLRGRDGVCSDDKLEWRMLRSDNNQNIPVYIGSSGSSQCWGKADSMYLSGDAKSGGYAGVDLVQFKDDGTSLDVFLGDYRNGRLYTQHFGDNLQTRTCSHAITNMNYAGKEDLVAWCGTSLYMMPSGSGGFPVTRTQINGTTATPQQSGSNRVLFGSFGTRTETTCE